MPKISRAVLALALCIPLLHACGSSDDGYVRLVNATTDYSSLDLYQSTNQLGDSVDSNTVGSYADLSAGSYTINVRSTGSSTNAASLSQTVAKGDHFTLVAYMKAGALTTTTLTDSESDPDSGYAKLRVFNAASSSVSSLDVYVTSNACSSLTTSDTAVASSVTGLQSAYSTIVAASAGTAWHVCVTAAGSRTDVRLDIPSVTFTSKEIATLVLTQSTGGYLLNGLVLDQKKTLTSYANTNVRLRLVAAAANGAAVSATANSTALASSSASPTVGTWKTVTAGDLSLTLSIGGVSVTKTGLTAAAGGDYSLLVAGDSGSPTISLLTEDDTPSTSTTSPVKMRFVNALNGLSGDVQLSVNGVTIGDSIAFGAISDSTNVAASAGVASLQAQQAGSTLWSATDQTLTSGAVYTVFLLGDSSGTASGVLRVNNN
jgi:hypothetical protein